MDLTPAEKDYLTSQLLGRLATVGPSGEPQVRPVGFVLNEVEGTVDIGGHNLAHSRKFANIRADGRVAFVVDDLATVDPWAPRGIEIRGVAKAISDATPARPGLSVDMIRIYPTRLIAWGLDTNAFAAPNSRNVDIPPSGKRLNRASLALRSHREVGQ